MELLLNLLFFPFPLSFLPPFFSPFLNLFQAVSLGLICFMPWKPKKSNKQKRQLTAARKARWDVVRQAQAPQQDEVQQEEERKDEDTSSSYAQVFAFSLPSPFGLTTTLSFCFSYPFCFCAASSGCEQLQLQLDFLFFVLSLLRSWPKAGATALFFSLAIIAS